MITYFKANVFAIDTIDVNEPKPLACPAPITTSHEVTAQIGMDDFEYIILKNFDTSPLDSGRSYQLMLFTEKGVQYVNAALTFLAQDVQANFKILNRSSLVERRENVKVSVNIPGELRSHVSENFMEVYSKPIKVSIKNISIGGMLLVSTTPLEVGDTYAISFTIDRLDVKVDFKIIRQDPTELDETYIYGCKFDGLSMDIDAYLCNYIYRVQIEDHRRRKNND